MILNLETVFVMQVSDHDTENLHFPGVGEEAARCEIFFFSSEFLFVKPHSLRQANHFLTRLQALTNLPEIIFEQRPKDDSS